MPEPTPAGPMDARPAGRSDRDPAGTPSALVAGDWHLASVTIAGLLELGYAVRCWTDDAAAFERIVSGTRAANEPRVRDILRDGLSRGRLDAALGLLPATEAARDCDLGIVAFDSSTTADGRMVDARPIRAAEHLLASHGGERPVVVSSQVRAGTLDGVLRAAGLPADSPALVHLPENLRLGRAIDDFLRPHRVIVGCNAATPPTAVEALLTALAPRNTEAELVKHGTNAYLAACITLANDVGTIAARLGADPWRVLAGVRADERVAPGAPLRPGEAYSGATLQRDVRALWEAGMAIGRDGLFRAISQSNAVHALQPVALLDRCLDGLDGRRICLLGLTYKPDVSTLRDSAAVRLAHELAALGCRVTAYDPVAEPDPLDGVQRCGSLAEAAADADCLVLTVEHDEFARLSEPDFRPLRPRHHVLVRTRSPERASRVATPAGWRSVDLWQP